MKNTNSSRRKFIGQSAAAATGTLLASSSFGMPAIINRFGTAGQDFKGVNIGMISYSFRNMPDQSPTAILDYVQQSGIKAIELMGNHAEPFAGAPENTLDFRSVWPLFRKRRAGEELTEDEKSTLADFDEKRNAYQKELAEWRAKASFGKFEELGAMYKKAGIQIYAFKPSAFGTDNTDAEMEYGMKAAKALGASHVTLEHPSDDAHTLKLGKMGEKLGMKIGYHGHEQQTPTLWDTALDQSPANMLNLDIGHYVAAGNEDPLGIIKSKNSRIASMHLKDRQTPANGKGNLLWGTGDTPIPEVLKLIRDNKYQFPVTVELEYEIPEGSDPLQEVKRCLQFCKDALA